MNRSKVQSNLIASVLLSVLFGFVASTASALPVDETIAQLKARAASLERLVEMFSTHDCSISVDKNKVKLTPEALRANGISIIVSPKKPGQYLAFESAEKISAEATMLFSQLSFGLVGADFEAVLVTADLINQGPHAGKLGVKFFVPRKDGEDDLSKEAIDAIRKADLAAAVDRQRRRSELAEENRKKGLEDDEESNPDLLIPEPEEFWLNVPRGIAVSLDGPKDKKPIPLPAGRTGYAECIPK